MTALLVAILAGGCQQRPTTPVVKGPEDIGEQRDTSLQLAADMLRQAVEFPQFNAALNQINGPLAKQAGAVKSSWDDAKRKVIIDLVRPSAAESEYLESVLTRPLDAAHLQSCFVFRDAARALELSGAAPLDQAILGCAWVMRRVLLHEQQDSDLPPHLVLQRGYGNALDRALVAAELLQQWKIQSCLIALPKPGGGEDLLLGILLPKKEAVDVFLFDPRLGLPVGGASGPATLAAVKAGPDLIKAHGIAAEQLKGATARYASSLTALAPRMHAVEELLRAHEQVHLHRDETELHRQLQAAQLPHAAWPAGDRHDPARRLSFFYAKEEGGVDTEQRLARFAIGKVLPPAVIHKYEQMKVLTNLPPDARDMLTKVITANLFQRYAVEPRLALLKGKYDDALRRVDRMGNVVDDAAFAVQIPEAEFNQQVAQWRERVRDAYLAGEPRSKHIWLEDQYLWALLQPDDSLQSKLDRKMLSHIVLRACREPLGNQSDLIKAACWEDRAAKLEAQAAARKLAGKAKAGQDPASAWKNARAAWVRFLDRSDVATYQLRQRLDQAHVAARKGQRELALGLCEQVHLDLHQALAGRLQLIETNRRLGQPVAKTVEKLREFRDELAALEQSEPPRKHLQELLDQARGATGNPVHVKRLELLLRGWTADGHLAALRQTVEHQLGSLK